MANRELHPFLAHLAARGAYTPPQRPATRTNGSTPVPPAGDPHANRYAASALDDEARQVANTPVGRRNHALNTAAFRMGQLVARGWLDEHGTENALIAAAEDAGLSYAEAERTVASGLSAGQSAPREDVELHEPVSIAPAYTVHEEAVPAPSTTEEESARPRFVDGGTFIHDAADHVPAVWGSGDDVLWAEGEPLLITGPTGVGKTTLGGMLVAARLGLIPTVLGLPVLPGAGKTLVLAMDRPTQIQRSMARLLRTWPKELLSEKLVIWKGPPPADLARHPSVLLSLADQAGADTVVLDSLKDAAVKLSDEETGQGLTRCMNYCVSNGVQVLGYHHQKKSSSSGQGKPNSIADVYGSGWITAGAGSVLLLWGDAGDLAAELIHLKQPADVVGPLRVIFDHQGGRVHLDDYEKPEDERLRDLLSSGPQTAPAIAAWLYGDKADRAAVMRAKRRLDKLVEAGHAVLVDDWHPAEREGGSRLRGRVAAKYALSRPITLENESAGRTENRGSAKQGFDPAELNFHADHHVESRPATNRQVTPNHGPSHAETHVDPTEPASPDARPRPPLKGGRGAGVRSGARVREGNSTSTNFADVEVCARCHQPAERFIPAPGGKRWCPECAYPTENSTKTNEEAD